jgi:hypothetical protein
MCSADLDFRWLEAYNGTYIGRKALRVGVEQGHYLSASTVLLLCPVIAVSACLIQIAQARLYPARA